MLNLPPLRSKAQLLSSKLRGQAMMLFLCLVRLKYLLLSQWLQPTHALMTALLLWDVSSGVRQPITRRFAQNHLGVLMDLAIYRNLAIGNGILTVENAEQAWERADINRKDKGGDAARAALAMAAVAKRYAEDRKLINDSKDNC